MIYDSVVLNKTYRKNNEHPGINIFFYAHTVICKSLHTASVAKQVSVAVGWVKIKFLLMAQLKGLTAKFKLM